MGSNNFELPKESRPGDEHTTDFEGHHLDVYKLIDLSNSIEPEEIPLSSLDYFRDNSYWHDANGDWISPGEIIEAFVGKQNLEEVIAKHPEWQKEIEKIKRADYVSHPLILIGEVVVDGIHRLTKAYIENATSIKIKRFSQVPSESILTE